MHLYLGFCFFAQIYNTSPIIPTDSGFRVLFNVQPSKNAFCNTAGSKLFCHEIQIRHVFEIYYINYMKIWRKRSKAINRKRKICF